MSDITTRIGALLAKAESTTNDIERDTYIAKAQELATKYAIDMELARLEAGGQPRKEQPEARRVHLFDWHDRSQTRAFFVNLYMAIGKANSIKFLIDRDSRYVVAHGFPSDIDITTQMYQSLSLQMVSAAERYLKGDDWHDRDYFLDRMGEMRKMTKRTARRSFYEGFTRVIGERCRDAARNIEKETFDVGGESTTGALVLADRRSEVDQFFASVPKGRGSWRGGGSGISGAARSAGQEAGRRASLGNSQSVSGGRAAINN